MKTVTKSFETGDTIYSEGEESRWAYEIVEGTVELFGNGPSGPVVHAHLSDGELFGEMGILDKSPRHNSAKAKTSVVLHAIPRAEFLRRVEMEPDTAFKVMSKAGQDSAQETMTHSRVGTQSRLRCKAPAYLLLCLPTSKHRLLFVPRGWVAPCPSIWLAKGKPNLFERIVDAVGKDPTRRPGRVRKAPSPEDVSILVGKVHDDYEDMQHRMIVEALSEIPGVRVESCRPRYSANDSRPSG